MNLLQKANAPSDNRSSLAFKAISLHIFSYILIGSQILILLLSSKINLFPGDARLMSILTTCSQIIAGLYGITLAGYTFFLSRIDALTTTDATLDYVVSSIKNRFKYLIWYITLSVLITLLTSIFLMYCPVPAQEESNYFYRLFCNEFLVFVIFSIILILYYSILVVDPNCIRKEAARLKKRLGGPIRIPGNAVEFFTLYNRIEARCEALLPEAVLHGLQDNKGSHFELTLQLLEEQHLLPLPVLFDLTRLHRYYECVVNCTTISVSQNMCQLAQRLLTCLLTR